MSTEQEKTTDRQALIEAGRVVVKIGSAVLMGAGNRVDRPAFASLVEGLAQLIAQGRRVTVVSSGAVAMGRQRMGVAGGGGRDIPFLQALAAMGQSRLVEMYEAEFSHHDQQVAQILFSRGDLSDRARYLNARYTLQRLESFGAIPIINENDTVATEELRFGDNDELAAMTSGLVGAQALILLSDVDGLRQAQVDADGERRFGERVVEISVDDPRLDSWAGPSESDVGTGGMISKVRAARIAARGGAVTAIARGKESGVLQRLAAGEPLGTLLTAGADRVLGGRKLWLGGGALAQGTIVCDEGARRAICEQGASLLPSGIVTVKGGFEEGEVVELVDTGGAAFGRGLSVYGADDLRAIAGIHSDRIEEVLGFKVLDEAIHRDNLVVL